MFIHMHLYTHPDPGFFSPKKGSYDLSFCNLLFHLASTVGISPYQCVGIGLILSQLLSILSNGCSLIYSNHLLMVGLWAGLLSPAVNPLHLTALRTCGFL